jgi:phage terminase Nu1 subunit (DNA packaging protein)
MSVEMTKKELATIAGYTYRRIYDIDRDLPPEKKLFVAGEGGKYDLAIFVQRWVEYNVQRDTEDIEDLDAVKARHEAVKIEKTELEVAKMRGQLIDVQDVKRLWGDVANTVMQNMIHLASKVAPMVRMMDNIEQIANIIDTEVRKTLTDIANTPLPGYAADETEESEEEDDKEV